MADNTLQTGSDSIATDDLTTLNGATITAGTAKAQRVKVGYGDDSIFRDASTAFPLPVQGMFDPDVVATGTITAPDAVVGAPAGAGVLVSGVSTAGSTVFVQSLGGDTSWVIQLVGTFGGGTIYFEESVDSTTGTDGNWTAVNGRQTGVVNTVLSNSTTTAGFFRGNTAGAKFLRVRMVGGAAPSVAATLRLSDGVGAVFLNASIPAGTNAIGTVNLGSSQGTQAAVSGSLTAAGANTPGTPSTASSTGQVVIPVATAGNATFHLVTAAFVGTVTFEGSIDNGSNYAPIMAIREDGTGAETGSAISTAAAFIRTYTIGIPGFTHFRVRCSAFTSGTLAVVIMPGPFLIETNPSLAASSSTIGGVLNPSGTRVTQTINAVAAGAAVAVAGYQSVAVTFNPTAVTGFLTTFQVSDDGGTTWYTASGRQQNAASSQPNSANGTTSATAWQVPVGGYTHFRLNTTTFTGTSMAVGITPVAAPATTPTGTTVQPTAVASGGATKFRLNSAATTNATSVKASAGSVYGWIIYNTNAAARFVKLYDSAAAPTVGTTVPAITIPVPAAGVTAQAATANFPVPVSFTAGIGLSTNLNAGDTDNSAVAAGDLLITLLYL